MILLLITLMYNCAKVVCFMVSFYGYFLINFFHCLFANVELFGLNELQSINIILLLQLLVIFYFAASPVVAGPRWQYSW